MKIAVLKEKATGEKRVAITPDIVKKFVDLGIEICIEKGAGLQATITDAEYEKAGAKLSSVPLEIIADASIVLKVQPSPKSDDKQLNELSLLKKGGVLIGLLSPFDNKDLIKKYAHNQINAFAMEFVPRITRAQTMDVLSSQSNLAGYKAMLDAAAEFGKAIPMMMTAAGTIPPAKVLVIGAGVAGLQAIATARRLGAVVSAFDVRAAAKEQVESLGAKFIEVKSEGNFETSGGYAKEMSDEYKQQQQALLQETLKTQDIVICTALIPGKQAPLLITETMLENMKPGSVIVDLAVASGGNCAWSERDQIVERNNIKIIGYSNMASRIAHDASKLYSKNLFNFVMLLLDKDKNLNINLSDEIIKNTLVTYNGEIVHPSL
jgi:NAD(P) transhydrogenase subunit alpha